MTSDKSGSFSMDDLMRSGFWEENRNRLVGGVVLIGVALASILLFQEQGTSKAAAGWESIWGGGGLKYEDIDMDRVAGTDAEPWALQLQAMKAWDDKDFSQTIKLLSEIQSRFPNHSINNSTVPEFLEAAKAEKAWRDSHPEAENNPDVPDDRCVTLKTSLGDIRVGLYPDQSPTATKAFLDLISSGALAASRFDEGVKENRVLLSFAPKDTPDEEGDKEANSDEEEMDESDEESEPSDLAKGSFLDRNFLSHYEGSVSFLRAPVGQLTADSTPRIVFYLREASERDDEEVVIGRVVAGLDLLKQIADRERDEESSLLKEPVIVDSIETGSGLK